MTGKEALEKIKNNQHYREEKNWIIATSLQNTEEYKVINKELDKLTKYKKVFEIFKRLDGSGRALLIAAIFDIATDEEYELLEELMKCEEDK